MISFFKGVEFMKYYKGKLSNQEIADLLSLSVPTVKTHKMHAYARLRAELEELRFLLLIL